MSPEPTKVLVAVLYKAGLEMVNETRLGKILAEAAENNAIFKAFKTQSQGEFSQTLEEKLDELVYDGLIDNRLSQYYFKVTSQLTEKFNELKFDNLDSTVREAVEEVANLIREKCVVSCC